MLKICIKKVAITNSFKELENLNAIGIQIAMARTDCNKIFKKM